MLKYGNLTINPGANEVLVNGVEVRLTTQEKQVFFYLVSKAGLILSQSDILKGIKSPAEPKLVDVQICKARKKIALAGYPGVLIENAWGRGYTIPRPGAKKTA